MGRFGSHGEFDTLCVANSPWLCVEFVHKASFMRTAPKSPR
jgi:hypothetical protein